MTVVSTQGGESNSGNVSMHAQQEEDFRRMSSPDGRLRVREDGDCSERAVPGCCYPESPRNCCALCVVCLLSLGTGAPN